MEKLRVEAFRKLKPPCVNLSQVVLQFTARSRSGQDVVHSAEKLYLTLKDADCDQHTLILDDKLADYVFFPLSHIFRESKALPIRAVEIAVQCLRILISRGWHCQIGPELGRQLVIFLSHLVGVDLANLKSNEDLGAAALECLSDLFRDQSSGNWSVKAFEEEEGLSILGYLVAVILDGIMKGSSAAIQTASLLALHNLIGSAVDEKILGNFFPGIVSSLTKVLQPNSQSRRTFKVLEGSLESLSRLLSMVFMDGRSKSISNDDPPRLKLKQASSSALIERARFDFEDGQLKAWASQVKMSLANVIRLRHHSRSEVQEAVFQLCASILTQCRLSLADSAPMLIETLVVICSSETASNVLMMQNHVKVVLATDTALTDLLLDSLRGWIVVLPSQLQANDSLVRSRLLRQISVALRILRGSGMALDTLNDDLIGSLRACIVELTLLPFDRSISRSQYDSTNLGRLSTDSRSVESSMVFTSIFDGRNETTLSGLQSIALQLRTSQSFMKSTFKLIEELNSAPEREKLGSIWLLTRVLDDGESSIFDMNRFPCTTDCQQNEQNESSEPIADIYSIALDILSKPTYEHGTDWRLQGVALEVVAAQARRERTEFRLELVEILYPVIERIGSDQAALRDHAITCLNILAEACGYDSSSDLVISNVDYLVNAIALQLNDIHPNPQSPQILRMMIKLSGARLLPFLDDLVQSVFEALSNYHGYTNLVESLLSVLGAIVEEVKPSTLLQAEGSDVLHRKTGYQPTPIAQVAEEIKDVYKPREDDAHDSGASCTISGSKSSSNLETLQCNEAHKEVIEKEVQLPNKIYAMVQSITRLGQHFLTQNSPTLRSQLLHITSIACYALCQNEDQFLPLINDIWPVIIRRLYDPEHFVSIAAAKAVSSMCITGGNFMSSRIESEWPEIRDLYWNSHRKLQAERTMAGTILTYTSAYQTWNALVTLIITLIYHVFLNSDLTDDVFEMLGPYLDERQDVSEALHALNPDNVWLELERKRQREHVHGQEQGKLKIVVTANAEFKEMNII